MTMASSIQTFQNIPGQIAGSLPFVLILLGQLRLSSGQYYLNDKTCAVFHSEEKYEGQQFTLKDRDQTVNLGGDHRASDGVWNETRSIVIESGCKLEVCNEVYFDGVCQTLSHGSYPSPEALSQNLTFTNITSASCNCYKECKCSDIYMKKSSCARGYFNEGCNTCHSSYTDMQGSQPYFSEEFIGKVKAFRLRKGCALTLYSEQDFEGEAEVIDNELVEDYDGVFGSYECECHGLFVPREKPPPPPSYPPLIDIPGSVDEVLKMLSNKTLSRHPGLRAAQLSLKHGRSSKNAYILLLGSTGSGKSSAINILFDNKNVTKVGDMNSTTTDILEFRVPVPVDEIGVANSELRVIDTPGMGDTRGLQQDAAFLATLDSYLSNHEELKDRIPNVVLFFHKFHDNRFNGEGSHFVRMLRGFDSFREKITDSDYSNVIFVLSHFTSVTKVHQKRPEKRLAQFKSVIENYSLVPKPIIITVAENKAQEQDLPMINGYFKLPNNEYYPKNLFEKMELVTEKGGDMMGLGVFRSAFRDSESFNITHETFRLQKTSSKIAYYFKIISDAIFSIEKTPVSEKLQQFWDDKIPTSLKKQFHSSLPYLQKALSLRNVNTKEDVPKTTTEILKLLISIKQDEATRELLKRALNIEAPLYPKDTIAGFSYNVFNDDYLRKSPFKMGELRSSDIGFLIPNILTCRLEPNTKQYLVVLNTREEYIQHRFSSLGIDGNITSDSFKSTVIKPGHNIKSVSFREDGCTLSATREFRLLDFVLNDKLDLSPEFEETVRNLPVLDQTDYETVDAWNDFFNEYGTHVVESIHGGGAIQINLKSDKPFDQRLSEAMFDLVKFAEEMSFMIVGGGGEEEEPEAESDDPNDDVDDQRNVTKTKTVLPEGIDHSLTFLGGDSAYHTNDLTKMTIEQAAKLLSNWKKSLRFNPVLLTTEMRLKPLSQIVRKKLGQNYSSEIDRATSLLFNADLTVVLQPRQKPEEKYPEARTDTAFMSIFLEAQAQSNQRMHEMMMESKQAELENARRREEALEKRFQIEREQRVADQKYQLELLQVERLAKEKQAERQLELDRVKMEQDTQRQIQATQLNMQMMQMQSQASSKFIEILGTIAMRPPPKEPSCLREGTKILMADWSEKSVQTLKVGELVMDKDLKPSKVLGVAYEFLLEQRFYGFRNDSFFFTDSHLFAGPSETKNSSEMMRLYALSPANLFQLNPLMEYLNVASLIGSDVGTKLFQLEKVTDDLSHSSVVAKSIQVFQDPIKYAPDTKIYFIQVDSPTGTYFANGFVCKHEIPPIEYWPNTMALLFRLMDTPTFKEIAGVPYQLETVYLMEDISDRVAAAVKSYIDGQIARNWNELKDGGRPSAVMTLADVDVDECISKIFNNPTVASIGVGLYAKVGKIISPHLDSAAYGKPNSIGGRMGEVQHEIFNVIHNELLKHLKP